MEQELNEELQFHLDHLIAQHVANGLSPEEARRAALVSMGGIERRKEEVRDTRHVNFVAEFVSDLQYSLRMLRRDPGFATLAVLTLTLGIGVNVAVFSMLDSVLFPRMPYPEPQQLVRIFRTVPESDSWPSSVPVYLAYHDQTSAFSEMAAFVWANFSLAEPGQLSERIQGMRTTADYFRVFGIEPLRGRAFTAEDDRPGTAAVVVLSETLWRRRFESDPSIVGRTIRVDGRPASVIGIMPSSFENTTLWGRVELWQPIAFTAEQRRDRLGAFLNVVGRLKPHVTTTQANADIQAIAARVQQEYGAAGTRESARIESLNQGDAVVRLWGWLGVAVTLCFLLIACVNLANLQLARTMARTREFAVRAALGGGRGRLMRQSLTESLVLSMIGCLLAVPSARWAAAVVYSNFSEESIAQSTLDLRMLVFAMLCSILSAVLFGTAPAWIAARTTVANTLKALQRNASASRGQRRFRESLIIAEIALSFVLLATAVLGIGSLRDAMRADRGWKPEGLLTAQLSLNGDAYSDFFRRSRLLEKLEAHLNSLPGVRHASLSMTPLSMWSQGLYWSVNYVGIEGRQNERILVENEAVSSQFFTAVGLPVSRGRTFTTADRMDQPQVVIINERMAQRFWPNENPVGKRLLNLPDGPFMEIVGIADDVRFPYRPVALPDSDLQIYRPIAQMSGTTLAVGLRTTGAPGDIAPSLRRAIMEIDPDLPAFDIATGPQVIERTLRPQSFPSVLLVIFAALGLALAGIGVTGVISYSISQRTGEIGIRMAIGAQRRNVVWLVLKQGSRSIVVGTGLGLSGAGIAALVFASAVPPVKDNASAALIVATATILLVALAACYVPARRASKMDPLVALRTE